MNVEIGTKTPIFLFWEYLFLNFGILSLQCRRVKGVQGDGQEGGKGLERRVRTVRK
jgi:hypothetical protein